MVFQVGTTNNQGSNLYVQCLYVVKELPVFTLSIGDLKKSPSLFLAESHSKLAIKFAKTGIAYHFSNPRVSFLTLFYKHSTPSGFSIHSFRTTH